jgi:lycopene beta-cyclase
MRFDYVLVGGGLQSALLVLALRDRQPRARVALVERSDVLGGNHTWSFHDGDLTESTDRLVAPLVAWRWSAQEVRFPGLRRTLAHGYASICSRRLDEVVRAHVDGERGSALLTGCPATDVGARCVRLADGRVLEATAVVDARGPAPAARDRGSGFQKFLGLEVTLTAPAGLERPVIMDATVEQIDGFRFLYVLPLADDRLLVEDTYYSESALLDRDALRARACAYAREQGWSVRQVEREEAGVLPLPWRGSLPRPTPPLRAGFAGGFFHPVTGYSLPVAARLAELVASLPAERLHGPELRAFVRRHAGQARFARLLNWLMFRAWPPPQRWRILERFYREMPEATIARFYALATTPSDRARLLLGRPPRGFSIRHAWNSRIRR